MWLDDPTGAAPASAPPPDTDDEASYKRMNKLLEHRVRELERELKRIDPAEAKRLGIE